MKVFEKGENNYDVVPIVCTSWPMNENSKIALLHCSDIICIVRCVSVTLFVLAWAVFWEKTCILVTPWDCLYKYGQYGRLQVVTYQGSNVSRKLTWYKAAIGRHAQYMDTFIWVYVYWWTKIIQIAFSTIVA